jgi:lipopolysaccharide/colanic/teichoic acid biosynthesis glycosyltransferase
MTARRNSSLGRRVLIFGAGETGSLLMKKIMLSPKLGATVVGFLDDLLPDGTLLTCELSPTGKRLFSTRVLGDRRSLEDVVVKHRVDELLIALPQAGNELIEQLLLRARELGIKAGFIPHLAGIRAELLELDEFSASPVLRMTAARQRQIYEFSKRVQDILISSALLGLTFPVWILAYLALRRETGGSLLFRQTRVGQHGVPFTILKFRTMKSEVEPYANSPSCSSDPRVLGFGRIFRAISLDEIPQFLNVMRGDMSLIGPRPEMPFIAANYDRYERRRLQVKPGLTGLWQISPDRSQEIHTNLEYDFYYLVNRGFILDTLILFETVWMIGVQLSSEVLKLPSMLRNLWPEKASLKRRGSLVDVRARNGSARGAGREPATVLIALDQRTRSGEPLSWGETAGAVSELVSKALVRIAVAPRNAERFQELLADQLASPGVNGDSIGPAEFIPYTRPSSVQTAAGHATVVVTDIDLFARLAANVGAQVVQLASSGGKREETRSWIIGEIDRILLAAS